MCNSDSAEVVPRDKTGVEEEKTPWVVWGGGGAGQDGRVERTCGEGAGSELGGQGEEGENGERPLRGLHAKAQRWVEPWVWVESGVGTGRGQDRWCPGWLGIEISLRWWQLQRVAARGSPFTQGPKSGLPL